MKGGRNLRDMQEEHKEDPYKFNCMICDKKIQGFYGAWGGGGTCSKKCEEIQEAKPKYPQPKEQS